MRVTFRTKMSSRQFVGLATNVDVEGVEVQFLRRSDMHGFVFCLPPKEDISWVGYDQLNSLSSALLWTTGEDTTLPNLCWQNDADLSTTYDLLYLM